MSLDQSDIQALRGHLANLLEWGDAHVNFESVVEGIPLELRGKQPHGLPYSLWQLLEHLRLTQRDILNFCREPNYEQPKWPDQYWPASDAPPSNDAWENSVSTYKKDREDLRSMIMNPALDLFARVPAGEEQTYLREALLVADHTAYHLGEMLAVRRLLGAWK